MKGMAYYMGDRGNIVVLQQRYNGKVESGFDQVWFYSHWGGSGLPAVLQTALQRKHRWDDENYLARIVFCEMLRASGDWNGETGYGISTRITDNEHTVLVVDAPGQRVFEIEPTMLTGGEVPQDYKPEPNKTWTFQEFCERKLPEQQE